MTVEYLHGMSCILGNSKIMPKTSHGNTTFIFYKKCHAKYEW